MMFAAIVRDRKSVVQLALIFEFWRGRYGLPQPRRAIPGQARRSPRPVSETCADCNLSA